MTKANSLKRRFAVRSTLRTVRASMPAPIMSMNRRPLTLPWSRERVLSPAMTAQARSTWNGMPSSRASTFTVPAGTIPSIGCHLPGPDLSRARAMPLVTSLMVPSPPIATTMSTSGAFRSARMIASLGWRVA